MSWFAVRDEDGKYWDFEGMDDYRKPLSATDRGRKWAEEVKANTGGSEIIEVVEKTAPIAVSEAEASLLDKMADSTNFNGERGFEPGLVITNFVLNNRVHGESHFETEDRLMRAYVIGWTVEKPKRYFVRVPHANRHYYYQKCDSGEVIPVWDMETEPPTQFTAADIEHYELTDCERVEVTDDGIR